MSIQKNRSTWFGDNLIHDVRCAARNMRRYPVASLVAIFSLAAGIGATTVTLTVRDIIFHRPPPTYQQPEQLSKIQVGSPENPLRPVGNPVPVALYQSWRETIGPSMAAWMSLGEREVRAADRTREHFGPRRHSGALPDPRRLADARPVVLEPGITARRRAAGDPQLSSLGPALRQARRRDRAGFLD